jgi:hypothetical protein
MAVVVVVVRVGPVVVRARVAVVAGVAAGVVLYEAARRRA